MEQPPPLTKKRRRKNRQQSAAQTRVITMNPNAPPPRCQSPPLQMSPTVAGQSGPQVHTSARGPSFGLPRPRPPRILEPARPASQLFDHPFQFHQLLGLQNYATSFVQNALRILGVPPPQGAALNQGLVNQIEQQIENALPSSHNAVLRCCRTVVGFVDSLLNPIDLNPN